MEEIFKLMAFPTFSIMLIQYNGFSINFIVKVKLNNSKNCP